MPEDTKLANRFNRPWTIDDHRAPGRIFDTVVSAFVGSTIVDLQPLGYFFSAAVVSGPCPAATPII
jgi:hypothetical protein